MPTNRGPHAGFYINIQTPEFNIRDAETGRFIPGAQKELYRRNRALAVSMQQQVAEVIDNSILRQAVKSGRLVNATLHPKNAIFGFDHVGVGDPFHLDQSIAKYWRTIEEGSAKTWTKRSFLSLELQGIWGTNVREGQWQFSAAGNEWSSLGGGRQRGNPGEEMYQPLRRGRGGRPSGLPVFHPTREIRPMRAYERVANDPNFTQAAIANGEAFAREALGRGITPARNFSGGEYRLG